MLSQYNAWYEFKVSNCVRNVLYYVFERAQTFLSLDKLRRGEIAMIDLNTIVIIEWSSLILSTRTPAAARKRLSNKFYLLTRNTKYIVVNRSIISPNLLFFVDVRLLECKSKTSMFASCSIQVISTTLIWLQFCFVFFLTNESMRNRIVYFPLLWILVLFRSTKISRENSNEIRLKKGILSEPWLIALSQLVTKELTQLQIAERRNSLTKINQCLWVMIKLTN